MWLGFFQLRSELRISAGEHFVQFSIQGLGLRLQLGSIGGHHAAFTTQNDYVLRHGGILAGIRGPILAGLGMKNAVRYLYFRMFLVRKQLTHAPHPATFLILSSASCKFSDEFCITEPQIPLALFAERSSVQTRRAASSSRRSSTSFEVRIVPSTFTKA